MAIETEKVRYVGDEIAALPAIANAIYDAVGVRLTQLPITPEAMLRAVEQQAKKARSN